MGVPVWPDAATDFPGPLAGFLVGLERCETDYLVTVPCDSPLFPQDLVLRLANGLAAADAEIAMPVTNGPEGPRVQPVFCLMKATLLESLMHYTQQGGRKIDRWTALHRTTEVPFEAPEAFVNANTLAELQQLQRPRHE